MNFARSVYMPWVSPLFRAEGSLEKPASIPLEFSPNGGYSEVAYVLPMKVMVSVIIDPALRRQSTMINYAFCALEL